jgi:hypothetical protein
MPRPRRSTITRRRNNATVRKLCLLWATARKQRVNPSRYRLIGPTFTSLLALVASGALNVTLTIPRCFFEAARLLQG